MTLPPRIAKKPKRETRWRSPAHLAFIRAHHCCVSDCAGMPIEAAHVRTGSDGGMGLKPSDFYAISLCRDHHAEQHSVGEITFSNRYGLDLHRLADGFAQVSPKAAEIRKVRNA